MKLLLTKWIKIFRSGRTVDGRFYDKNQAKEMAETYSPKIYLAKINEEHKVWDARFGNVLELKHQVEPDGEVAVFAKMEVSEDLIKFSRDRHSVSFSAEVNTRNPPIGEFYLGGIAATVRPAVHSIDWVKFSANDDLAFGDFIQTDSTDSLLATKTDESEPPTWAKNLLSVLKPKEKTMDKEQFNKLLSAFEGLNAKVEALSAKPSESGDQDTSEDGKNKPDDSNNEDANSLGLIAKTLETLASKIESLEKNNVQVEDDKKAKVEADEKTQIETLSESLKGLNDRLDELSLKPAGPKIDPATGTDGGVSSDTAYA